MSGPNDRDSDRQERELDPELLARVAELAAKAAARYRVPDYDADIAQLVAMKLWEHRQQNAEVLSNSTVYDLSLRFAREESTNRPITSGTVDDAVAEAPVDIERRSVAPSSRGGTPLKPAAAFVRAMESKTPQGEWSRVAPAILSAMLDQESGRVGARFLQSHVTLKKK